MNSIMVAKFSLRGIFILTSLSAAVAHAQNNTVSTAETESTFSLFETLDSTSVNNAASAAAGRTAASNRGSRNTVASPAFTLIGTTRIGNNQSALLKHLNGDLVRVPLEDEVNTIPGYELYAVVSHSASEVKVRFPVSVPCADFPDQGVSCDSTTNLASLSLTTAEAIPQVSAQISSDIAEEQNSSEPTATTETNNAPRNPFAAIRDRARSTDSTQAEPANRFQPRRIDPADVPPGMRVVSTPFGDRLVEQ